MATLEQVTAALASDPDLWWGHSADLGWVVVDRRDYRNDEHERFLICCRDWSTTTVSRLNFASERYVGFKKYLASLPPNQAESNGEELLRLSNAVTERAAGIRVTPEDLERQRQEADREARQLYEEDRRRQREERQQALMTGGWSTCTRPSEILDCLGGTISQRKLRLFGCACFRRVWDIFTVRDGRRTIEFIERFADGEVNPEEVRRMRDETGVKWQAARTRGSRGWQGRIRYGFLDVVHRLLQDGNQHETDDFDSRALFRIWETPASARCYAEDRNYTLYEGELKAQADLLRDLLGNLFRPVTVASEWRTWNDSTVVRLARAIYAERRFEELPILADTLEEAGCNNETILSHCRGPGPHVRGCWVIDLLLGRE